MQPGVGEDGEDARKLISNIVVQRVAKDILCTGHANRQAEARRRTLVGIGGLLLMLLLVMLAGFLSGQFRKEAEVAKAQAEAAGVENPGGATAIAPPTEPLGDVTAADEKAGQPPLLIVPDPGLVADGAGGVTVPDLQPDPELEASKNRR